MSKFLIAAVIGVACTALIRSRTPSAAAFRGRSADSSLGMACG